ncbi:hypothetical protein [Candidatus Methylacidiphilum infernorum]
MSLTSNGLRGIQLMIYPSALGLKQIVPHFSLAFLVDDISQCTGLETLLLLLLLPGLWLVIYPSALGLKQNEAKASAGSGSW